MRTSKTSTKQARRKLVAGAGVVSAVPAVSTAGPAAASTPGSGGIGTADFSDCPVGQICVYVAVNGGGVPGWRGLRATPSGSCTFSGIASMIGFRGARSVYNRTGVVQKVYASTNCTCGHAWVNNGEAREDLGTPRWSIGGI